MKPGLLTGVLVTLALVGCSTKPTSCSDEKTIELVKRIFFDSLAEKQKEPNEDATLFDKMKLDVKLVVSTIRTSASDEKVGKVTCDAVLVAELPATAKAPLENPNFRNAIVSDPSTRELKVNGLMVSTDIQYTSQLTDDKKEQLVEMRGSKGLVNLVSALGNMGAFKSAKAEPVAVEVPKPVSEDRRVVANAKLQSIECNDYCQLKYLDTAGNSQSALCLDAEQCRSWAKEPKSFASWVGATAELTVVKKFIPEGNTYADSVVAIFVNKTEQAAVPATTNQPSQSIQAKAFTTPGSPLCKVGETTAFACSTSKKDIALCAANGIQGKQKLFTYRISPIGQAMPEMVYPEQSTAAASFMSGSQQFSGDKSMVFASFDKGAIRYVLYSAVGKGLDKAGVVVEQAGKRIANLVCTSSPAGDWSMVIDAGLPTDSRGFDLP